MALAGTGDTLGNTVADAIIAVNGTDLSPGEIAGIKAMERLRANIYIAHLIANTVVTPGTFKDTGDNSPVTGAGALS